MDILLKRQGALGDVLLAAAVAPALKKKHNCKIIFDTACPEILVGNPYVDGLGTTADVVYDLEYENNPHTPILECYAKIVDVPLDDCKLFLKTEEINLPNKYITIHAGWSNWVGRDWYDFNELAKKLKSYGHTIVSVGTFQDSRISCDVDLRGRTTVQQLAHVIKNTRLFIGNDSFPMHVSEVFSVPAVVFFGTTDPKITAGKNVTPIKAKDLSCLGCHRWKKPPRYVNNYCEQTTERCVYSVKVEQFMETIDAIL